MIALAGIDALAMLGFGTVYAAAGTRLLGEAAFGTALLLVFLAATALWLRIERLYGAGRRLLGRAVRVVGAFLLCAIAVPALVLMVLFFFREHAPPEVGLEHVIAPAMFLLLASLALTATVNLAGIVCAGTLILYRWFRSAGRPLTRT